ncbi:hypothetical protein DOT_1449 [Desulfosporosinus sp. OT]|nr:hypothetical protein DOT_1449 [Desulfosporosinus sp. OT]
MNYQRIAELVHELVKNPKSLALREQREPLEKLKVNEFTRVQKAFSKLEVSGDALTFETIPLDYW